jgi:hypothetical protein
VKFLVQNNILSKLLAGTTVGSTKFLHQWYEGIEKLNPHKIAICVDDSRHEDVPNDLSYEIIHYDTGKAWENYDLRHKNFISDYSIGLGIRNLIGYFLQSDCDRFVCLDSDVVLDDKIATKIRNSDFDYLQIGVPETDRQGLKVLYLMWKGTNFGLDKEVARKLYPKLQYEIENSKPVDLILHDRIRSCDPKARFKLKSRGLIHYFNRDGRTRKVSSLEAEMKGYCTKPLVLLYEINHRPLHPTRNN